jgi:retron-type reverse transcriptase
MEEVVCRENMTMAYRRVVSNKGAPGVDGVTVDDLNPLLWARWEQLKQQLLSGSYKPQPVRKVEIPKPGGKGVRMLGIPTVIDRLIQQALLQVLGPLFDPTFSDSSFGFRPGRSAHQALDRAQEHIASGHRWVVDRRGRIVRHGIEWSLNVERASRRCPISRPCRTWRSSLTA